MRTDINEIEQSFERYLSHETPMVRQLSLAGIMESMSFDVFYTQCISRGLHEDLMEVASGYMTKEQIMNCYCVIKDKMDHDLKRSRRQNIDLNEKIKKWSKKRINSLKNKITLLVKNKYRSNKEKNKYFLNKLAAIKRLLSDKKY